MPSGALSSFFLGRVPLWSRFIDTASTHPTNISCGPRRPFRRERDCLFLLAHADHMLLPNRINSCLALPLSGTA